MSLDDDCESACTLVFDISSTESFVQSNSAWAVGSCSAQLLSFAYILELETFGVRCWIKNEDGDGIKCTSFFVV